MSTASTAIDLTPIIQPILDVVGLVIAGLIAAYIPKAIAAFEARTGVQIAAAQQTALVTAVQAAAGTVETRIDQQAMSIADVHIANPAVRALAAEVVAAAPAIGSASGVTEATVARMIVGSVDTGSRMAPVAPTAPPVAKPSAV